MRFYLELKKNYGQNCFDIDGKFLNKNIQIFF